ncbi:hypothetical protein [Deefgea rivuli]|uniref:hypothetical protein n=1 Tax=Deefgea rivuli TaxID=400948 RepID=UPI001B80A305|nr:hypothetical protein [Deefgea rivuli]
MLDTDDGSGDAILEFPPELLAQLGWQAGDLLVYEMNSHGHLQFRKTTDEDQLEDQILTKIANDRLQDGRPLIQVNIDDL